MSFHTETHTITISSGSGSTSTNHKLRGLVHQILIFPTTETTTWDYDLLEQPSGVSVHGFESQTGSVNATFGVEVPMQNKLYTISFFNVSADEDFTYRITVKEPAYGYGGGS
jgi:hypothetical protein